MEVSTKSQSSESYNFTEILRALDKISMSIANLETKDTFKLDLIKEIDEDVTKVKDMLINFEKNYLIEIKRELLSLKEDIKKLEIFEKWMKYYTAFLSVLVGILTFLNLFWR